MCKMFSFVLLLTLLHQTFHPLKANIPIPQLVARLILIWWLCRKFPIVSNHTAKCVPTVTLVTTAMASTVRIDNVFRRSAARLSSMFFKGRLRCV